MYNVKKIVVSVLIIDIISFLLVFILIQMKTKLEHTNNIESEQVSLLKDEIKDTTYKVINEEIIKDVGISNISKTDNIVEDEKEFSGQNNIKENSFKDENIDNNEEEKHIQNENQIINENIAIDSIDNTGQDIKEIENNNERNDTEIVYGKQYGRLIIDKIGVNAPIFYGANEEIIKKGIGHEEESYLPNENGSIIMCGHNYMNNFRRLEELKNGDIIQIETSYGNFSYRLYDSQIVFETEREKAPIQNDKEILMIYTCYPLNNTEYTQYRYIIYAERI